MPESQPIWAADNVMKGISKKCKWPEESWIVKDVQTIGNSADRLIIVKATQELHDHLMEQNEPSIIRIAGERLVIYKDKCPFPGLHQGDLTTA